MSGPPPKPTTLKILQGNPGKRKLNKKEPKPKNEIPTCPSHLCPEGKKEWKRMVKELAVLGLITKIDRAALAAYCTCWAKYVEASLGIRETGYLVESKTGVLRSNPLVTVQNKAIEQMKALLIEFGMTPASRSRIALNNEDTDDDDPWDKF